MKRTVTVVCGLLWTAFVASIAMVGSPSPASARSDEVQAEDGSRPPLVVVRALGNNTPTEALRLACRTLLASFPVRCEIRSSRSFVEVRQAWSDKRQQLDAREALELLFRDRASHALAEINVTAVDIYEPAKPFVFGLASLTDRVAVVSLARIGGRHTTDRLRKLVLHETAHTLGLHHHDDVDCVMRQDPTVASLDTAPKRPCAKCRTELARSAKHLARPGQIALDRGRSHLIRGEAEAARSLLLGTVWAQDYDAEVLTEFGVAFHDAHHWDDAVGVLKFVVQELDPDNAQAHVHLGLAYQMRGKDGDIDRAIRHFERAVELKPEWTTVAAHINVLQAPSAQGP
jgi:predicted Zn-dependent protease